ncbi:hypothetical protein FMM68_12220 [Lachnospiraceae bacterium MD329]|nr:hypothetical protein [Lachnospiraceae bacterium MD329]
MKDKIISCVLTAAMLCPFTGQIPVNADNVQFTHQNVVGSQTCYGDDTDEKTITEIPNVIQGMRINQPVFRANGLTANASYTVNQLLKDGTVLKTDEITADTNGTVEFKHVRNCEAVEILSGETAVASLGTELQYTNGVAITSAPMSYQIYQRDDNNKAEITIKGKTENNASVSVKIGDATDNVTVTENEFTYTKTLTTGLYDITVLSGSDEVAKYEQVGVGDVWVAAGQSNMTDMGAITDGFNPETDDPINENMHIIYAEDCTWHAMSHPSGEGRFFKTGTRTSPVTSFAREIAASENVPVGIVQSSVGGTNIFQWITGVRDSDANSGYLFNALKSCFDKMPSHNVKGILWYQGCNDAINENYAYDYKNLQTKMFSAMRDFFGKDTPIITTQLNDANQDSNGSQGYYDAWSFVKDVQRQNESLYEKVYVVGTGELELGDTIHNSAASNVQLGAKWAKVAKSVVYGDKTAPYRNAQIDTAKVTGDKEITLTFKDTDGLKLATGVKRIGITNVSGGGYKIALCDLTKEFVVRKGASRRVTASNKDKGTEMTIVSAELQADKKTVIITTEEEMAGIIAVDCMYGKRFTPTLVDTATNESVLSFYNVIAEYENKIPVTEAVEIPATDTADLNNVTKTASDKTMYVNYWKSGEVDNTSYGLVKFDLGNIDFSKIVSAKLAVYGNSIGKDRSGNITLSDAGTDWDNTAVFGNPTYSPSAEIAKINSNTASVFPTGNYSAIDITEYLRKYTGGEIGIGISSNYASDVTLSGINSENPPKLIIQPGKMVTLTYTCEGEPCADMEVSIEAVGATEYQTTKHTTDADGKLVLYLAEGSYKAVTEKEISKYNASANTFTVSADDVTESYAVEKNTDVKPTPDPKEDGVYDFTKLVANSDDAPIKKWEASALTTPAKIGDTGISLTIASGGGVWTTAKLITNSEKGKDLLAPNGSPEFTGTYLFIGSGGNATYTLKLPKAVEAGKYINFRYLRPRVSNNGKTDRTAKNTNNIAVGNENVNAVDACAENDKAYITSIYVAEKTDTITFTFGTWSSLGIESIYITDTADVLDLTAEDNVTEKYITPDTTTVQYSGNIYNSVTYKIGSDIPTLWGTKNTALKPTYSVNSYNGVSIDQNGSLSISPSASAGIVTVSAEYGGAKKSINLTLKALGSATAVEIYGDEVVKPGTAKYTAIPLADGVVIPPRDTKWEIVGEANGISISTDGTLTVPDSAAEGVITIKATLTTSNIQSEEISKEFKVTIRTEASKISPYEIKGLLLKNGETDITKATGIDGIIIEKTGASDGEYAAAVKVFDKDNRVIAKKAVGISGLLDGVSKLDFNMTFTKAAFAKIYIAEASDEGNYPVSDKEYEIAKVTKSGTDFEKAVVMQNKKETATDAKLIVAQYTGGALSKLEVKPATLQKGVNQINLSDISVLDGAAARVFLWDDLGTMKPLADTISEIRESGVSTGAVISDSIFKAESGEYSNIPLVSDWITGAKSGLGMGAGIIAPDTASAPYGVDPALTNVSALNVSYTYDDNYKGAETDNALWYKTGAFLASANGANNSIYARDGADWEQQALPIGNGYMGGMLFGLPDKDQIQINEETFWAAGYRGTQTPVGSNTVNSKMSEGINGYMSVGNIFVDFNMPKGAEVKNYYRDLNLNESVAHVRYEYDGKQYNREYFASYPKEVLAFRYTGDDLNFDVKPVSMHSGEVTVNNGEIKIVGKLKDSEPYSSGGNAAWNQESDLEYCTIIKVIADDGTVTDGYNTVNVSGSTGVTILVAAATDYDKDEFDTTVKGKVQYKSTRGVQAAIEKAEKRISGAASMTYDELKQEHIADYKSQFDKVKFSLTDDNEVCSTPTNELQASYKNVVGTKSADGKTVVSYDETAYSTLNKHLEELHYNYARYMMISSSRSNTMPATLQGKWCQSTAEIWGSCYCININMEMNYWFAGGANLLDSGKSLIGWFNSQIPAGRVTAKNMYKVTPKSYTFADGKITFTDSADDKDDVFIMHTKQAIMGTTDMTGSTNIQSAGNTAWLMYNIWDLYQTTGDKELLANELYPIMRKCANFYTQYLYTNERKTATDTAKYPDGYYYTTWEGRSPEQGPTHEGIKYDLQLVAGMYDYTIAAAQTLGVDADKVVAWKEIRNHLEIPVELGTDGQIKEWAEETSYNTDASGKALGDPVHRHISHLVGLYPGTLINRDTPELLNGAKIVLNNRGDDSTGWSCSNKFLLWARTLEGDKALELFRYQLAQKTYANLFDTHAPFQIDGNFGSAAGVMELLMQSQTGDIYILPALPTAWDKGEISGIKTKNGAEVSIKWNDGKATEIKIVPAVDGDITIGYEKDNTLTMNGADVTFTNGKYTINNAVKGTEYVLTAK